MANAGSLGIIAGSGAAAAAGSSALHFEVVVASGGVTLQRYTYDGSTFASDGAAASPGVSLNTGQVTLGDGSMTLTGGVQGTPTLGVLYAWDISSYLDRDHPWTFAIHVGVGTFPGANSFYLAAGISWSSDGQDLDYCMLTGVALSSGRKPMLVRNDLVSLGAFDNSTVATVGHATVSTSNILAGGQSLTIHGDGTAGTRDAEVSDPETVATPDLTPYLVLVASGDSAPAGIKIAGMASNWRAPV